jgi:hypothetical protein
VPVVLRANQRPRLPEGIDDRDVSLPQNAHPDEIVARDGRRAGLDGEPSLVVDGTQQFQPVLQPGEVILLPVAGGGVDEARAGLGRDVVAPGDDGRRALVERMPIGCPDQG